MEQEEEEECNIDLSEAPTGCLVFLGTETATAGGPRSNLFLSPLLGAGGSAI